MTDIYVQPGASKYLKFGKAKLVALRALRLDLGLPTLRKHYVPEAGFRVDIETSETRESIRCWGGGLWPLGLTLPAMPPYSIRETMTEEHYGSAIGIPSSAGVIFTHTLELVVGAGFGGLGGEVIETYSGTKNVFDEFLADRTNGTITYTNYPGSGMTIESGLGTGQVMNGVVFSSTAGGNFNNTVVTSIPNFGVAAEAAANRPIVELMAAGTLQTDWKQEIIARDPLNPDTPFTEVLLMPFEAVQAGTARGMFPDTLPVGVDQIQIYGVAKHRYNHETDAWTFMSWSPVSAAAPYVRITCPDAPWPVYNFAANYGLIKKTDIPLAAAARAALTAGSPVVAAALRALHQL